MAIQQFLEEQGGEGDAKLAVEEVKKAERAILQAPAELQRLDGLIRSLEHPLDNDKYEALLITLDRLFTELLAGDDTKSDGVENGRAGVRPDRHALRSCFFTYHAQLNKTMTLVQQADHQMMALVMCLQNIKLYTDHLARSDEKFAYELFDMSLRELLSGQMVMARKYFFSQYLSKFVDIGYATLKFITRLKRPEFAENAIEFLHTVNINLETSFTGYRPSHTQIKKAFQEAWFAVMRMPLDTRMHKAILIDLQSQILPHLVKPQLLIDYLTIAYDQGGVISLLALDGLYSLIQQHNLDYPRFYDKLYALFDDYLLHVRYRSRFFRLSSLFLSSTHLSATIVASFIKRLARLSLEAPPSAIVIVIPLIYNLLKLHSGCMPMIHKSKNPGFIDPFDPKEADPTKTGALQSSLWEIETHQSHYHPAVSTLAKIMSEQFTKPSYDLEDFLDHTYITMVDSELKKGIRKPPAVQEDLSQSVFEDTFPTKTPIEYIWAI